MAEQATVVLIHGLFGFRRILWIEYFQGIKNLFQDMGLRVLVPSLPWAGTIEQRAACLAEQLKTESGPLHLVAHSMGGLDSRRFITHLGGADKVASLTTIATPHRGSAAADHVCSSLSPMRIFPGLRALTTKKLAAFNAATPDQAGVLYRSYSGSRPVSEHPWIVRHYGRIIAVEEGDNDSQVSIASAVWGEHLATLPGDHFELIGRNFWFNPFTKRTPFDHLPLYRDIGAWIVQQAES